MGYFDEKTDKYFATWILPDTWYSPNETDMEQFYYFVKALYYYQEKLLTRTSLEEKILKAIEKNHPNFDKKESKELAKKYSIIGHGILDFYSLTKDFYIPDQKIENKDLALK